MLVSKYISAEFQRMPAFDDAESIHPLVEVFNSYARLTGVEALEVTYCNDGHIYLPSYRVFREAQVGRIIMTRAPNRTGDLAISTKGESNFLQDVRRVRVCPTHRSIPRPPMPIISIEVEILLKQIRIPP
jgi:hypothetical protein